MSAWWLYSIVGTFLVSLLLSDVARGVGRRFGFLDQPSKPRKQHKGGISTLGGVAIGISLLIGVGLTLLLTNHFVSGEVTYGHFAGIGIAAVLLLVGGLLDDRYDLPPYVTIVFVMAAALVTVLFGVGVSKLTNPLGGFVELPDALSMLVTFVWIVVVTYTTKLLDGLDGLAGGVSAIGMFIIALLALSTAFYQPDVALLALLGVAALVGFLFWNSHPASLFLGEGGSTFVGFFLAVLAVIAGSKMATALLVVAIPFFDVVFVVIARLRAGKPFWKGDRQHLHHRLRDAGLSHRQVVAFYYVGALLFGLSTLIFTSWQKLVALGVLFVITMVIVLLLTKRSHVRD